VLEVFLEVILPVLTVAAVGGWVADRVGIEVKPLSQLTFYVFSPALAFDTLADVELEGSVAARIALAGVMAWIAMVMVSMAVSVVLGHDRATRAAMALVAALVNGGNMGLPIAVLAFGDAGLEVAIIAFVSSVVLANTGGIVLASMSGGVHLRQAWIAPLLVPSVWAAALGLAVAFGDISVPDAIGSTTATLAGASIPVMLVVLGMHVRRPVQTEVRRDLVIAVALRLVGGPLLAWGATLVLGLDGVARDTLIVLGGMPTAVITTIYATQYGARPVFVTRAVIVSTLCSVATLTVLVALLR
jgi:hypothetical protein